MVRWWLFFSSNFVWIKFLIMWRVHHFLFDINQVSNCRDIPKKLSTNETDSTHRLHTSLINHIFTFSINDKRNFTGQLSCLAFQSCLSGDSCWSSPTIKSCQFFQTSWCLDSFSCSFKDCKIRTVGRWLLVYHKHNHHTIKHSLNFSQCHFKILIYDMRQNKGIKAE